MHLASSPSSAVPQTSCAVPITSPVGRDRAILCGRGKRGTGPSARRRPLPDCANRGGFLHSESTCLLSSNNIANFSLPLVTALADERHWPRMACHSNLCIRSCPAGILCTSDGGQRQTLPQLSHRRLCKCGKGVRPWMRPPNGRLSWCPPTVTVLSLLEKAKIEYFASTSVEMNSVFLLELAVTNTFILML